MALIINIIVAFVFFAIGYFLCAIMVISSESDDKMERMSNIPDFLAERKSRNLSQREVSEKTGISSSTISRIEKGKSCKHENYLKLTRFYFGR